MENNKVIQFHQVPKKEPDDKVPCIDLGTIYLDLQISCDKNNLHFIPSYELDPDLSDEMLEEISNMLNTYFYEALKQLFDLYKSKR